MKLRFGRQHPAPPWLYPQPANPHGDAGGDGAAREAADSALLDSLQKAAFHYFVQHAHPRNGLVADASREGAPCSIAVVGFALSAYAVGVQRGWMDRADAVQRTLRALRFFADSDQSGEPGATGHRGFYFHFLDMDSGRRVWQSELSIIDTALLLAGVLTAAAYFTRDTPDEADLRALADALYRRCDWTWAQDGGPAVSHGWKPEHGFISYAWEGYSEALIMYVLGLGSPTHPLGENSFRAWTMTYQWENLYGYDVLYAGPLFIHQLSHAWLDLRGLRDAFMREKHCDYFENSRRAAYVHMEYAIRNPLGFKGYGDHCWGLSAGDGPVAQAMQLHGRQQPFFGYAARGAPYGPDDGTVAGPGALGSLVFAPEIVMPLVRKMVAEHSGGGVESHRLFASGFNATVSFKPEAGWVSSGQLGFDQGISTLMIENHRSELMWQLSSRCSYIRTGLRRAGFKGGWLNRPTPQPWP